MAPMFAMELVGWRWMSDQVSLVYVAAVIVDVLVEERPS